jgi:dCTP diphosphatase
MKTLIEQLIKFRNDRDWEKDHTPKNLACSISIEANEILEIFQWNETLTPEKINHLKTEIADVAIYLLYLCSSYGIDLNEAIREKIIINEEKYPIELENL